MNRFVKSDGFAAFLALSFSLVLTIIIAMVFDMEF